MRFDLRPLSESIGASIEGIDLTAALDDREIVAIRNALAEHSVLVFPDQPISTAQHVAFSRRFGTLMAPKTVVDAEHPDFAEITVISANIVDGKPVGFDAGRLWHSDQSYRAAPAMGSLLHGIKVPKAGGDTLFASQYAAYVALSDPLKRRIAGLRAVHSFESSAAKRGLYASPERIEMLPPVAHPVVRTHPESGRKALYVSESYTEHLLGLPEDESSDLLRELTAHQTQPEFVYCHEWRQGDLVFWDNRSAIHKAMPYDTEREFRLMYRTTLQGDAPC